MRADYSNISSTTNSNFISKTLGEKLRQFNLDLKSEAGTRVYRSTSPDLNLVRFSSSRLGIIYPFFIVKGRQAFQIETDKVLEDSNENFDIQIRSTGFRIRGFSGDLSLYNTNNKIVDFYLRGNEESNIDFVNSLLLEPLPYRIRAVAYHNSFGFICFCAEPVGAYPVKEDSLLLSSMFSKPASTSLLANAQGKVDVRAFMGDVGCWREVLVTKDFHQSGVGVNNYRIPCELGEFFFPSPASSGSATLTPWKGGKTFDVIDFEPELFLRKNDLSSLELKAKIALKDLGLLEDSILEDSMWGEVLK